MFCISAKLLQMVAIEDKLSQVNWDFPDSDTKENINSIHPYPAKFIPEIPRNLIRLIGLPPGTCVLDPFCGSGATLVEAQMAGFPAIGIDLNPIACLISQVKTRPPPADFLDSSISVVEQAKKSKRTAVPKISNLDHWFQRDIQEAIARLLTQVDHIKNASTKDALYLSLSSILVRVSNQESDTRYAAVHKKVDRESFYALFLNTAARLTAIKALNKPKTNEVEIACKNILEVTPMDFPHSVGLVVTSPPYPNAYEYWLYHKYRMFWLGYDPIQVKNQEIGARAHYFKKNHQTEHDFRRQMRNVLELLWAVIVKGGCICIIIGRSIIHGRTIDNASMLTEIAGEVGFTSVGNISRQISSSRKTFNLSHANIKTENILVFRK
ncbi:MAG: hypothetical protein A2X59_03190 [Nitrospirae bacterium GWC2_42_7]|nr:MAG: hypothetical protein A2X59_03190 [Nitrospirae bacterium GWC2_42_7]